jgi:hypothetical protein
MPDFGERRDMTGVATFADPDALFEFGFEAPAQTIINESNVEMEISWDGKTVHAILTPGVLEVVAFTDHLRPRVFIRRVTGALGTRNVQVLAATR